MVPELTELTFYYMNLVTVSRVQRNPTVKGGDSECGTSRPAFPVGFFCYPISQAADITAFHATAVPCGRGSDAHAGAMQARSCISSTAYTAKRLTDPQDHPAQSNKACLRLPGIDGKAKMSKSLGNCIYLSEEPEDMHRPRSCPCSPTPTT